VPPRHTYWTIILEGKPTAFRARTEEELLPTLRQLQSRHPDAVLLWFARGRLWKSPEEERAALAARRSGPRERRAREWRPGGAHRDPRERFEIPREEKRRRFRERVYRDRQEPGGDRPSRPDKPGRDRSRGGPPRPGRGERKPGRGGGKRGGGRGGPSR
jgi:hypothetical protein